MKSLSIRLSNQSDILDMVQLSYQKRKAYEEVQPQFWRHAENAEIAQAQWFESLLFNKNYILLTATENDQVAGFAIGNLVKAPEVYAPKGLTLMIDDFCVQAAKDWESVGAKLLQEIKQIGKAKGASQVVVVCGAHDRSKKDFLSNLGLGVASEWYVGSL